MLWPVHIPGIEIEAELGHGAHSVVYRGRQGSLPCAVKLPRVKGRWTRWVYREAVALARVRDPGLPKVLEVGVLDDLPYLVMELVEGETLANRLLGGPLHELEAIELATSLVRTLGAVHDAGLVHRDVKPRNLILDPAVRVRLVDFGFATPMERAPGGRDDTGSSSNLAETPRYAAPEQFRTPSRIDARTDLYAVGRVLFECLTGGLPASTRTGDEPYSLRLASPNVARAHLVGDLLAANVRSALAEIVADLLADDPDQRYPDARAVLGDLVLAAAGEPARGPAAYEATPRATALTGRDADLQRMLRAWNDVEKSGCTIVLKGTRGSGKTRMVVACVAGVRDRGGRALTVHCRDSDPPLAALRRILEAYASALRRASPDDRSAGEEAIRAAAAGPLGSFATLIAPVLASILGPTTPALGGADGAFTEGAAELFIRLAQNAGPILISVDDLQWADPVSREVLIRLAHRTHEAPLVLLLATRTDPNALRAVGRFLELDPSRASVSLELAQFGEPQIAALVAAHLGERQADPALVRRIAVFADGTPLGILEVLGAFLDAGALRPHAASWTFDAERAERVTLPEGALALLGRRISELPPATRRVLETAAALGTSFDDDLLAQVESLEFDDLGYAFADARRAGLVEAPGPYRHRFVHDSLREMLIAALGESEQRGIHQRIAEVLSGRGGTSLETLCATALHFAAGEIHKTPLRAYEAARAAADAALGGFDNETALRFLELARSAAAIAGMALEPSFHQSLGEAELRLGALDKSLVSLETALDRTFDRSARAVLLGRISWVHQTREDHEQAWAALERAFQAIGARMPIETATSAADTLSELAKSGLRGLLRTRERENERPRAEIDLLCDLHYQNARLGLEYNKPLRLIQSTLRALEATAGFGPSRAQARARAMHGFVITAMGRRSAGARDLADAQAMASTLGDPVTNAFCVQLRALAACFAGEFDRALELLLECLEVHGTWLELHEYCLNASNAELIESLRGRSTMAWTWVGRALDRLRRSNRTTASFIDHLVYRARAVQASLGQNADGNPWLAARIESISGPGSRHLGFLHLMSWGPRARFLLESGDLGPAFDDLVRAFEVERHNPRFAHPTLVEYYIAVAHARIHLCLRSPPASRGPHIAALRKAVADLRVSARIPLFKAHAVLAHGYLVWFEGSPKKARSIFADAEKLAEEQTCPWVLYAVARARAHMLRTEGKSGAALDQARFAEMLAQEHGAARRAQWIREEFALPEIAVPRAVSNPPSESRSSNRARRHLAALLQIVRAPAPDSRPEQHAAAILDDLLRDVDAERGLLWFQPDAAGRGQLVLGRNRRGETQLEAEGWRDALLRNVREHREPWPPEEDEAVSRALGRLLPGPRFELEEGVDPSRVLAVPLLLHDAAVGAICLERSSEGPAFGPEDRELLFVLAHQVPVALEIARLLAEREQLQASLQRAQKMEAVGQLAGGVAHDFNNMLTVMQASLETIRDRGRLDAESASELALVTSVAQRAAQLTRQLLAFSRHRPVPLSAHDTNEILSTLEPMLRRVVGKRVNVVLELAPGLRAVKTDRTSFEQALVNLAVNARDAMPGGGSLTIKTSRVRLDEAAVRHGAPRTGEYVSIAVTDTGQGMSAELLERVFEPFFTTKALGGGTGLGLTTVYAFAKNSGGLVDVWSDIGRGTTFRICLPLASERPSERAPAPSVPPPPRISAETLLVVDDEPFVARSIRRILERQGYRVLVANSAAQGLELAQKYGPEISLAILDVLMPDTTGPELAQSFADMQFPGKVLYVSGFAPGAQADVEAEQLLEKPFSATDLLTRVRQLLDA